MKKINEQIEVHDKLEDYLVGFNSMNDRLEQSMDLYKDIPAITDRYNNVELTYGQMKSEYLNLASAFQSLGLKKDDHVAIFSENHGRWVLFDLAILKCGAIDAVRGSNAPKEELDYIIGHSDSTALVLRDDKTFNMLKPYLNKHNLKFIALMFSDGKADTSDINCPVYTYEQLQEMGKNHEFTPVEMNLEDDMTILYTSGTTGNPKGVLLSHKNMLFQIVVSHEGFLSQPGENTLQILPVWHAYERVGQYYYYSRGCHLHFTTLAGIKNDMARYHIDTMMSVPRIWEAVRNGIYQKLRQNSPLAYRIFVFAIKTSIRYKKSKMYREKRVTNQWAYHKLSWLRHKIISIFLKPVHVFFLHTLYKKLKQVAGLDLRASVSGGGALSAEDEFFYDAIGVNLRTGYGLTETAPVLTLRGIQDKNFLGSAGKPVRFTEIKIVNPETFEELGIFTKGLVMARGPQIMKGYYKDEAATKAVITEDGWFNTGDLGWLTRDNNLVLVGRMKETIVLSSGENVEPVPIEEAILISPYIEQIMLVGQDEKDLGALVIPSKEAFEKCGLNYKIFKDDKSIAIANAPLRELIKNEIDKYIKKKPNLRGFEKVKQFEMLNEEFNVDNGMLSQSAKLKRNNVFERYKELIQKMYNK